jgi:transcriptional regulator with XRE-family HTH domain
MYDENIHTLHFEDFLNALIKQRGLTLKKLSELTGISIKHLAALTNGDFAHLPSSPYFRGYLMKLGTILEFDPNIWWTKFKEGGFVKDAGTHDAPARNRFIRPGYVKFLWTFGIALLVVLYAAFRFASIMGRPTITLNFPNDNPAYVATSTIDLVGTLKNGSDLYVNGESVSVNPDGAWKKSVLLQSGANSFEIRAKKFLGGETTVFEEIIYEPASVATTPPPTP